jgi:hypothetical protein
MVIVLEEKEKADEDSLEHQHQENHLLVVSHPPGLPLRLPPVAAATSATHYYGNHKQQHRIVYSKHERLFAASVCRFISSAVKLPIRVVFLFFVGARAQCLVFPLSTLILTLNFFSF